MAALTQDIKTTRYGVPGNSTQPVGIRAIAANTTVYGGSICLTNSAGAVKNASSPASTDTCWGLVLAQTQNTSSLAQTSGIVQDIYGRPFEVQTGTFYLQGGTGPDALTQANIGETVYVIDEQTVGATNGSNTRPIAGVLIDIDTTQPAPYAVAMGSNKSSGAPS
jgi:hypothetical protein